MAIVVQKSNDFSFSFIPNNAWICSILLKQSKFSFSFILFNYQDRLVFIFALIEPCSHFLLKWLYLKLIFIHIFITHLLTIVILIFIQFIQDQILDFQINFQIFYLYLFSEMSLFVHELLHPNLYDLFHYFLYINLIYFNWDQTLSFFMNCLWIASSY